MPMPSAPLSAGGSLLSSTPGPAIGDPLNATYSSVPSGESFRPRGRLPNGSVSVTLPVAPSMTLSVPPRSFVTKTRCEGDAACADATPAAAARTSRAERARRATDGRHEQPRDDRWIYVNRPARTRESSGSAQRFERRERDLGGRRTQQPFAQRRGPARVGLLPEIRAGERVHHSRADDIERRPDLLLQIGRGQGVFPDCCARQRSKRSCCSRRAAANCAVKNASVRSAGTPRASPCAVNVASRSRSRAGSSIDPPVFHLYLRRRSSRRGAHRRARRSASARSRARPPSAAAPSEPRPASASAAATHRRSCLNAASRGSRNALSA